MRHLIAILFTIVIVDPYKDLCTDCIVAYHYDLDDEIKLKVYEAESDTEPKEDTKEDETTQEWVWCHFCFPPAYIPK